MVTVYRPDGASAPGRFPFSPESIPDVLKQDRSWVLCDEDKVPFVARMRGEALASHSKPETWSSYEQATEVFETGLYAGVGRVIEWDGPYAGVDLDNCREPRTGEIAPEALRILEQLNSYAEVSPSLTGVKIWIKASISTSHKRPGLEVYYGRRYFTVTGMILPQFPPTVKERTEEIRAIIAKEFPPAQPQPRRSYNSSASPLELDEVLENGDVKVLAEVPDGTARIKFRVLCPWSNQHTRAIYSGSYVGQYENGALFFRCHHAHCEGRGWSEFRREVMPKGFMRVKFLRRGKPGKVVVNLD
jgi:hypothetical protein